jgi:hypothetical protein
LEQVSQLSLLCACQLAEHRRLGERGDQVVPRFDPGWRQSQRLDTSVAAGARAAHEAPLLEPIHEEGDVRRVASQALSKLTSRQRAERRIELPEGIGQRDGQLELLKRVMEMPLQRGV